MPGFLQLHDIPAFWARQTPQAVCLRDPARQLCWAQLWSAIETAAQGLDRLGLRPGDRLALVGENCISLVVLLFAASLRDLWSVPLNARLAPAEIEGLVRHAGARAVLYTSAISPAAARHAVAAQAIAWPDGGLPGLALALPPTHPAQAAEAVPPQPGHRIATLIYTTGTTGAPKGVMLRHRNLLAVAALSATVRAVTPEDRAYAVLPLSHVFAYTSVLMATLQAGGCVELAAHFSAASAWSALADGVTVLQGVPTLFARLLEHDPGGPPGCAPGRLRALFSGGAPLDLGLKAAVEARFGLPLHNGYGLTENGPSIAQTRIDRPRSDDAVGPALPGLEVRVLDEQGRVVPQGHTGQLWVRGPGVMAGYFREPALTAEVLVDGWLATGDLVRQGADAALFVMGRAKEMIIRSGFKVYPLEVEQAILRCLPGVEVAVLGVPAVDGDEEVVACIAVGAAAPPDTRALTAALRSELAPYKIPARYQIFERFPLSPAGKVRKHALRALLD